MVKQNQAAEEEETKSVFNQFAGSTTAKGEAAVSIADAKHGLNLGGNKWEEAYEKAFHHADTDKDGLLTFAEFKRYLDEVQ